MENALIPIALFLMLFSMVAVFLYFRHKSRQEIQITMRAVIESGQPLSAELLEEMTASLQSQRDDLRRGVILLALGAAIGLMGLITGEEDALGVAAFPVCIALAYLGLWWANGRKTV